MAALLEDPDSEFNDFVAFFHLEHPTKDDRCMVIPAGLIEPDRHLMSFVTQFLNNEHDFLVEAADAGDPILITSEPEGEGEEQRMVWSVRRLDVAYPDADEV